MPPTPPIPGGRPYKPRSRKSPQLHAAIPKVLKTDKQAKSSVALDKARVGATPSPAFMKATAKKSGLKKRYSTRRVG